MGSKNEEPDPLVPLFCLDGLGGSPLLFTVFVGGVLLLKSVGATYRLDGGHLSPPPALVPISVNQDQDSILEVD